MRAVVRRAEAVSALPPGVRPAVIADLGEPGACDDLLRGAGAVVHLAARAHVLRETARDPIGAYRAVNVVITQQIVEAAARASVGRFVFLSSIAAMGSPASVGRFSEDRHCAPETPYGRSKLEAEQAVLDVAARTRIEHVILRPPLVYGPGVRGHFQRLLRLAATPWPLPLGGFDRPRSMLFIGNLCDAIATCLRHPGAGGEVFLVADAETLSTRALVTRIRSLLGRPTRLVSAPQSLMRLITGLRSGAEDFDRLSAGFVVSTQKVERQLGWVPEFRADDGLRATVDWFSAKAVRDVA